MNLVCDSSPKLDIERRHNLSRFVIPISIVLLVVGALSVHADELESTCQVFERHGGAVSRAVEEFLAATNSSALRVCRSKENAGVGSRVYRAYSFSFIFRRRRL